jgi:tetratricopeptide (TPR) repeat protein
MPYLLALWHYARGVASAAVGDLSGAEAEVASIDALLRGADWKTLSSAGVPAADVLTIAREIVVGRIAQTRGDAPAAVRAFQTAVAIEDKLAYMEPPFWYYPVRQSLGAALLQAGDIDGAERSFRAALEAAPNSGWALFGLHETLARRGESAERIEVARRLDRYWVGDRALLSLAKL